MRTERLHEPWKAFLQQVDKKLAGPTEIHCFGGFVVAECYGVTRATADVDIIEVRGSTKLHELATMAGRTSELAKKYKVYLDVVTVATVPYDYEERLVHVFPEEFRFLKLLAFEPHDLALAKLERNQDHDRADVRALAASGVLDVAVLKERYLNELRPYLGNPTREDLTLDLWVQMISEAQTATAD